MHDVISELFDILETYVCNEDERMAVYSMILPILIERDPNLVTQLALENEMFQAVYEEYTKDEEW